MTAHKAFQFCLQYKRTTEFRRLCEILRNHLTNLNKYRDQRDRPELSLPETLQLYTETRFEQLKVATELELWQEAFRSVEDIHGLMSLVKKVPKPQLMASYYAKLTKIFQVRSFEPVSVPHLVGVSTINALSLDTCVGMLICWGFLPGCEEKVYLNW